MESDFKSARYRVTIGLTIGILALLLTSSFVADRELAQAKEEYARLHPEDAARAEAYAEFEKAKGIGEKKNLELKQWGLVLEGMLKDQAVPPGTSRLCYVSTPDLEAGKFEAVSIFTRHLSEKKIARAEEQRGAEKVVVWSNLDAAFVKEWLQVFEKVGVKAWVEEQLVGK